MIGRIAIALIFVGLIPLVLNPANAQSITIPVNQTDPCFLNYTAGIHMLRNCGFGDDYLKFALAPFMWVTGGYFSMIIVSLFVVVSYQKYHKAVYPVLIGVLFLPVSFFLFPDQFIVFGILMTGILFGILIWHIFIKQTKEY